MKVRIAVDDTLQTSAVAGKIARQPVDLDPLGHEFTELAETMVVAPLKITPVELLHAFTPSSDICLSVGTRLHSWIPGRLTTQPERDAIPAKLVATVLTSATLACLDG
jgi:hypothetical protein